MSVRFSTILDKHL